MKFLVRIWPDTNPSPAPPALALVLDGPRERAHRKGVEIRNKDFAGRAMVITRPHRGKHA